MFQAMCSRCCQERVAVDIVDSIGAILKSFYGLIAQWIEHLPSKPVVVGSSPTQSVSLRKS